MPIYKPTSMPNPVMPVVSPAMGHHMKPNMAPMVSPAMMPNVAPAMISNVAPISAGKHPHHVLPYAHYPHPHVVSPYRSQTFALLVLFVLLVIVLRSIHHY